MQVEVINENTQQFNDKLYWLYEGNRYYERYKKRLHRAVWEYHNGPIPKGFHVHHKDNNRANNSLENLELLSHTDHAKLHMQDPERIKTSKKNIEIARIAASQWHKSEAGRAWHREQYQQVKKLLHAKTEKQCDQCGKLFKGIGHQRFCHSNCKQKFRRIHCIDNETRNCKVCNKPFQTNMYGKIAHCSKSCAAITSAKMLKDRKTKR
jgi:hypothetical protein